MARHKGTPNRNTQRIRDILEETGLDPVRGLIHMAQHCEEPVLQLRALIELTRLSCPYPKAHATPIQFELGDSYTKTCQNIITGIASGQIPPDVGAQVLGALDTLLRAITTDEILSRLNAVEQAYGQNTFEQS